MVSIASEKVTEMFSLIETPVWLSVGDMEETVGAVVSFSSSFFSFLAKGEDGETKKGYENYV